MGSKRLFTVQEANELIPFLSDKLSSLRLVHQKLSARSESLPSQQDIMMQGGMLACTEYMALLTHFQGLVEDICSQGCLIKDLESGLVDFPTLWEGREVVLCWKLGESEVGHWHEVEAGFAGRQSLENGPE